MTVHQPVEASQDSAPVLLRSDDLFSADNVVEILHNGMIYTLRITRPHSATWARRSA